MSGDRTPRLSAAEGRAAWALGHLPGPELREVLREPIVVRPGEARVGYVDPASGPPAAPAHALAREVETARMNKLESRYGQHLAVRLRAGEIVAFRFQPLKLRLADSTFYSPDFLVVTAHRAIELHETKGFMRDDAAVKIKVAAAQYPWFLFRLVRADGAHGWDIREVAT